MLRSKATVVFLLALACVPVPATHFMSSTYHWSRKPGTTHTFMFTMESAYRLNYGWGSPTPSKGPPPTSVNIGDVYIKTGTSTGTCTTSACGTNVLNTQVKLTVSEVYPSANWFSGTYTWEGTLPDLEVKFLYFSHCCRQSTLRDSNNDKTAVIIARIDPREAASPRVTGLPREHFEVGRPVSYRIPGLSPQGYTLTYSTSPSSESSLTGSIIPKGGSVPFRLNEPTGTVTWTPSSTGLYSYSCRVSDGKSTVPLDFVFEVVASCGSDPTCNRPPTVRTDPSFPDGLARFPQDKPRTITVISEDPDDQDTTIVMNSPLPAGASLTLVSQSGPRSTYEFSWLSPGNATNWVVCYKAQDSRGKHSLGNLCITNQVVATDCPVGQAQSGSGSCEQCARGEYSTVGICDPCEAGSYSTVTGSSQCDPCQAGRYSLRGASTCAACQPGRYSDVNGTSACTLCAAGRYGSTAGLTSPACTGPCAPGYTCPAGSTSAHQEDIDECETATHACPDPGLCYNLPGSYVCKPVALSGNFTFDGLVLGAHEEPTLSSTQGGQLFGFHAYLGNATSISVYYGPTEVPRRLACRDSTLLPVGSNANILCATNAGYGRNLSFTVDACVPPDNSLCFNFSTRHLLSFHYPGPIIKPGTLRELGGSKSAALILRTSEAVILEFDGANFGSSTSAISVTYGTVEAPNTYVCTVLAETTHDTIQCATQPFSTGSGLVFTVSVEGQSAQGVDFLTFPPEGPTVTGVSGCMSHDGNRTSDCPTSGGLYITVTGRKFEPLVTVTVFVSGKACAPVRTRKPSYIVCALPPGTGGEQPVVATADGIYSPVASLLSYAPPNITKVTGCEKDPANVLHTRNCNRMGAQRITIAGLNFGGEGATVLVGSDPCTDVRHDGHETLTCELPPNARADRPLIVVQQNGMVSRTPAFVSYQQCHPGEWEEGLSCRRCPLGRYTNTLAQSSCLACDAGQFANATGSTGCASCPAGRYSGLAWSACQACMPGSFSPAEGQSQCRVCSDGTASSEPGAVSCDICAPGTYAARNASEGASACQACEVGRFAAAAGSTSCTESGPGHYVDHAGLSSAQECLPGTFNPDVGASGCNPCAAGSFISIAKASACKMCEPGSFSSEEGSSVCEQCVSGRFSMLPGATACSSCEPGSFSAVGASGCALCPPGQWSSANATGCTVCPGGTFSRGASGECIPCPALHFTRGPGSSACVTCDKNQFPAWPPVLLGNTSELAKHAPRCADCPGAICSDGQTVVASDGYYLAVQSDGSVKSFACPAGHCKGGTACEKTYSVSPAVAVCCGENRAPSPLCGQCMPGYTEVSGECIVCDEANGGLIVLLLFVAVAFLVAFHHLAQAQNPFTKQLFYFVQIVVLLFGPSVSMVQFLNLFNFNVYESGGAVCVLPLSPANALAFSALVPILQVVLLFVIGCVHGLLWLLVKRVPSLLEVRCIGRVLPDTSSFKRSPYIRTACVLALSSYNSITTTAIKFFSCTQVDEATRLVTTLPSLSCDSDEYRAVLPFFLFLLIVVVVGLPVGLFAFLTWAHKAQRLFTTKYKERYGTLFEVYQPKYYYYEVVVLVRRVILIGIMQGVGEARTDALGWAAFAGSVFLALHFLLKPFTKPLFNATETVSLLFLLLVTTARTALTIPLSQVATIALGCLIFFPALLLACITLAFALSNNAAIMKAVTSKAGRSRRASSLANALHWLKAESRLGSDDAEREKPSRAVKEPEIELQVTAEETGH